MNSVIDLVILIVLALGLVWGFLRGFPKKRLDAFASQMGSVVAYFAGGPLCSLLSKTNLTTYIQNGFVNVLPSSEAFDALIDTSDITIRNNQLSKALSEIHIFKIFQSFFVSHTTDFTNTVKDAIASSFANIILVFAIYLLLFFLTFFIIKLIFSPLWNENSLFGENGKNFLGRVFGGLRMVFKSAVTILCVLIILNLVASLCEKFSNPTLSEWIDKDLNLSDPSFSIGKLFYKTASSFFGWIGLA